MMDLSFADVQKVKAIASKFEGVSEENIKSVSKINNGRINRTYKISVRKDGKVEEYLLQRINTEIFKDPRSLMSNVVAITEHIRKKGQKTISFLKAKGSNEYYVVTKGLLGYWRCYSYIDANVYDCINDADDMEKLGSAVAQFAYSLSDFDAYDIVDTIPDFHNTPKRFTDMLLSIYKCTFSEAGLNRVKQANEEITYLINQRKMLSKIEDKLASGKIPLRVTHNDPKLNNVLFDADTDIPICMIDLDTVMPGSILYDIGDAIRYGANTASEEEKDVRNVKFDINLFERFIKGYIKVMYYELKYEEFNLMYYAPIILTLELAIRFLTDYLDGNKYFSVEYETQNLVRARVQIELARQMINKIHDMKDVVEKYYNDPN